VDERAREYWGHILCTQPRSAWIKRVPEFQKDIDQLDQLLAEDCAKIAPYPDTLTSLGRLHDQGHDLVLLTDLGQGYEVPIQRYIPEYVKRFFSFDAGVRKPDPQAFKIVLDALKVAPQECIFIDDRYPNIRASIEMGMEGLLITRPQTLAEVLEQSKKLSTKT
jgi:putative hydrolase of the HAD superfamily